MTQVTDTRNIWQIKNEICCCCLFFSFKSILVPPREGGRGARPLPSVCPMGTLMLALVLLGLPRSGTRECGHRVTMQDYSWAGNVLQKRHLTDTYGCPVITWTLFRFWTWSWWDLQECWTSGWWDDQSQFTAETGLWADVWCTETLGSLRRGGCLRHMWFIRSQGTDCGWCLRGLQGSSSKPGNL